MIFGEIVDPAPYPEVHRRLEEFLRAQFRQVESGLQGDSWFWVCDGGERVEIDTFHSMNHQVKSVRTGPHVQRALALLATAFQVKLYVPPVLEPHEDGPAGPTPGRPRGD